MRGWWEKEASVCHCERSAAIYKVSQRDGSFDSFRRSALISERGRNRIKILFQLASLPALIMFPPTMTKIILHPAYTCYSTKGRFNCRQSRMMESLPVINAVGRPPGGMSHWPLKTILVSPLILPVWFRLLPRMVGQNAMNAPRYALQ